MMLLITRCCLKMQSSLVRPYTSAVGSVLSHNLLLKNETSTQELYNTSIRVAGWVKTIRQQKSRAFIEISDGSTHEKLQIIVQESGLGFDKVSEITTGSSILVKGRLVSTPTRTQKLEVVVDNEEQTDEPLSIKILGLCPSSEYPLLKGTLGLPYLRKHAHLRCRTQYMGSVARIRSALFNATHKFFYENGMHYVSTPIISTADCEGAGELFHIAPNEEPMELTGEEVDDNAVNDLNHYFGKQAFLTCSGQLSLENYCCGLGHVYTFGPTFRSEQSHTTRHLSEFWMLEPELAWADIDDAIKCAEDYIKYCINYALESCAADIAVVFDVQEGDYEEHILKLKNATSATLIKITYRRAVDILNGRGEDWDNATEYQVTLKKPDMQAPEFGDDLHSDQEKYLTNFFNGPVAVTNYPLAIKSFYMKKDESGDTVRAFDILFPGIGEIVGGSQREDDLSTLEDLLKYKNLDPESYWWYIELRKYGTIPHSGFGVGFERLLMYISGVLNIRDAIPFPRYPRNAHF